MPRIIKRKAPKAPVSTSASASAWDIFSQRGEPRFEYTTTKERALIFNSASLGVVVVPRANCLQHEDDWGIQVAKSVYRLTHTVMVFDAPINPVTSIGSIASCLRQLIGLWERGFSPSSFSLAHYSMSKTDTTFWPWHIVVARDAFAHSTYARKRIRSMSLLSIAGPEERAQHLQLESALNFYDAAVNCIIGIADLLGVKSSTHTCPTCYCSIPEICHLCATILVDCKFSNDYILPIDKIQATLSKILD